MEPIKNFSLVLEFLNDNNIVYFLSPNPNYCVLKHTQVEIMNHLTRYVLSMDDFISLFEHETFYMHHKKEAFEIDPLKDEEYYGKRYQ